MESIKNFSKKFNFNPKRSFFVGMERECFLVNGDKKISPIAAKVLRFLEPMNEGLKRFGYELSACQIEDRVGPCGIHSLKNEIEKNEIMLKKAEREVNFTRLFQEVAPKDMPLDIFPDPTGRYQEITKSMSREILLSACRVAGTHFHIGMPSSEIALKVYNEVIKECEELCKIGDNSNGERMSIYKTMAPDFEPVPYDNWRDYYQYALLKNFYLDPRKCWHLIRISIHGTIEFRMFGAVKDIDTMVSWGEKCHKLCENAFNSL